MITVVLLYSAVVAYILKSIDPGHWLHFSVKLDRLCRPCVAFWISVPLTALGLTQIEFFAAPFLSGAIASAIYYFLTRL